nr:GNAT family N-acetyltransferase [uncultured Moellerella sp.]
MYRRLIPAQSVDNIQLIGYQTKHTSQLSSVEKEQIYQLLFQVFEQGFSREDFDHTLGGIHILAYDNHQLIGHVAIVQRSVIVDCSPFRIGYLEGLGVAEAYRRQGIGRKLMELSSEIIANSYDFGLLSASEEGLPLYQSLGWKIWTGELYESNRESYQRSFDDEGSVLFWAASSQNIAATSPLYCDYRSGDQW